MDTGRRLVWQGAVALGLVSTLARARTRVSRDAAPPEVIAGLPSARLQGEGRLSFFGLPVYDARLWATDGFDADSFERHLLALELHYLRRLDGTAIAERSLAEMRRLAEFPDAQARSWLAAMGRTFPDVRGGDRIVGTHLPERGARFFLNGRQLGEIVDAEFSRRFFAIWLSPRTSQPALRSALIAGTAHLR